MIYICSQCGNQIPEDADFCYACGCLRSKALVMDDDGRMDTTRCHMCGEKVNPGESFCGNCGAALVLERGTPAKLDSKRLIALALAIIPGFFNIFGLGRLGMRQWARGLMFIAITVVLSIICPFYVPSPTMFIVLVRVGVFMYHALDIMRYVYAPEVR